MAALSPNFPLPKPTPLSEDRCARRPTKKLPKHLIEASRITPKQDFDAKRHVNFVPPGKVYTMEELGLGNLGISPIAVSEPFKLFTSEAIEQMRRELFSENVLNKHQYASTFAQNMIRGHCPKDAPFITKAWKDQKVLNAISQVAGIELIPCWSYDTGHANISVNTDPTNKEITSSSEDQNVSAFGWHYDSVPFVCVTMLSDCTNMIGGETMIRTGHNTYMKLRGPSMGTAVIMQGRHIHHQALKALANRERITMVTSLRPKSPFIRDESVLTGVRGISDISELYYQYTAYRLRNLDIRVQRQVEVLDERYEKGEKFDVCEIRRFLVEQREYIDAMLGELVEVQ